MDALLQKNTSPRPPRPFRLGLAIGADGALTDASVIGTQPDALAAKFAEEIRQQASALFYPPASGAIQIEMAIEYVARRLRKSG
jgi:hypothetical protein